MTLVDYKLSHCFACAGQTACGVTELENPFVKGFSFDNDSVSIIQKTEKNEVQPCAVHKWSVQFIKGKLMSGSDTEKVTDLIFMTVLGPGVNQRAQTFRYVLTCMLKFIFDLYDH